MALNNITSFVWKRHQNHWSWIIMLGSLFVLVIALWVKSVLLTLSFIAGIAVSMLELPEPTPPFALVGKAIEHERNWLESPWGWKKGLQGFGMFASVVYVFLSCWGESLMALLLLVGIYANIACVYGNKRMGIDDL
ncbi:hypothetical protein [Desulfovibrio sp. JC022]|uniref:hypothetical protein n=1 Tax=Desulfovibrio sp. JC022 TaxID=2593642 RepID=UPI001EF35578|nr:hypothetical protein [Desulfovibrio sp. JC022]